MVPVWAPENRVQGLGFSMMGPKMGPEFGQLTMYGLGFRVWGCYTGMEMTTETSLLRVLGLGSGIPDRVPSICLVRKFLHALRI